MKRRSLLVVLTLVAWLFSPAGLATANATPANTYVIHTRINGLCLDADTHVAGAGATVNAQTCNSKVPQQQWQSGKLNGFPVLVNLYHPGNCLDANNMVVGSGFSVQPCSGRQQQDWEWDPSGFRHFTVYNSRATQFVLTDEPGTRGTRIKLQTLNDANAYQSFTWERIS